MEKQGLTIIRRTILIIYIVVLVVLFILAIAIEKGDDVTAINGNHTHFADVFFSYMTWFGDGVVFLPVTIVLLFYKFRYALMSVALSIIHGLMVSLLKRVIFPGLPRPIKFMGDENIYKVPGISIHALNAFPSGHTTTAFAAATMIALISNRIGVSIIALVFAMLVGYSRIYLAQHFLVDVVAGAWLGVLSAFLMWQVFSTNRFPPWSERSLRRKLQDNEQLLQ